MFLATGRQGLKRRGRDPSKRELIPDRAKLGEMTMRMELARERLEEGGYGDQLKRPQKRASE